MFVSDKYEGKGHKNKAELVLLFPVLFSTVRKRNISCNIGGTGTG